MRTTTPQAHRPQLTMRQRTLFATVSEHNRRRMRGVVQRGVVAVSAIAAIVGLVSPAATAAPVSPDGDVDRVEAYISIREYCVDQAEIDFTKGYENADIHREGDIWGQLGDSIKVTCTFENGRVYTCTLVGDFSHEFSDDDRFVCKWLFPVLDAGRPLIDPEHFLEKPFPWF